MKPLRTKVLIGIAVTAAFVGCRHFPAWILKAPPGNHGAFPTVILEAPDQPRIRSNLGLDSGAKTFALSDIQADLIIVEVMDMYCRYCQKSAPAANRLQQQLAERSLGKRVKMIGIAMGNSRFEANFFARKYHVRFPLFPDPDSTVRDALGRIGTPSFYALEIRNGTAVITGVHHGVLNAGDPKRFLDRVLRQ